MSRVDDFTSTVDGAAAFERYHGDEGYDDGPSLADVAGLDLPLPPPCPISRTLDDGSVEACGYRMGHLSLGLAHKPLERDPWA